MKRIRQYIGILAALIAYYIIHEGAHLFYALTHGVFKHLNILAFSIQIDIFRDKLSDTQLGWFCLVGPIATFVTAQILVLLSKRLCSAMGSTSKRPLPVLLACCWYTSIILLLLDPLYLTILYRFVGGGDMNGIRLLIPETNACIIFGFLFLLNILELWKILLPRYKKAFNTNH